MDLMLILKLVALVTGVYEVIVRIFPTVGDITIIGNIIRILMAISNALNNKK